MAGDRQGQGNGRERPDQNQTWLTQILGRPLFDPDRHAAEAGVRGLPRLSGIILYQSQRVAIFTGPSGGHPIVAQPGTHIGAYEVRAIANEGVTVVGPEGTTVIRPMFDSTKSLSSDPRPGASSLPPHRP
jgi:hypothetical protein